MDFKICRLSSGCPVIVIGWQSRLWICSKMVVKCGTLKFSQYIFDHLWSFNPTLDRCLFFPCLVDGYAKMIATHGKEIRPIKKVASTSFHVCPTTGWVKTYYSTMSQGESTSIHISIHQLSYDLRIPRYQDVDPSPVPGRVQYGEVFHGSYHQGHQIWGWVSGPSVTIWWLGE
jgi:hypothetical protein